MTLRDFKTEIAKLPSDMDAFTVVVPENGPEESGLLFEVFGVKIDAPNQEVVLE